VERFLQALSLTQVRLMLIDRVGSTLVGKATNLAVRSAHLPGLEPVAQAGGVGQGGW